MKILFTDGSWRLISLVISSEIQHHCVPPDGGGTWWFYAYDGQCGVCRAEVPEPLLGLRNLQNWDR